MSPVRTSRTTSRTGGRRAARAADARAERRRDEEATARSDERSRPAHPRQSAARAATVTGSDVGASFRAAGGGNAWGVLTAAEVSRRGLARASPVVRRSRQASVTRQQHSGALGAHDEPPAAALDSPTRRTGGASEGRGSLRRLRRSERSASAPTPMRRRQRERLQAGQGGRRRSRSVLRCKKASTRRRRRRCVA